MVAIRGFRAHPTNVIVPAVVAPAVSSTQRVLGRLQDAARAGCDLVTLWRTVTPVLQHALPHAHSPCFFTVDPESIIVTSHFQEGLPEIPTEWLAREYTAPDHNAMTAVIRSRSGVGTLHDATGGRPEIARKFHEEMQPFGCEQELIFALRTPDGTPWGAVGLYREAGQPLFDEHDTALAAAAGRVLAEGARFAACHGQASKPDLDDPPGLVVLSRDYAAVSATPAAAGWLAELGGDMGRLPAVVVAAAGAARTGREPLARARGTSGRWVDVHAAPMQPAGRVAVVLQDANPLRLAELLMAAYGLTRRERDVVREVIAGRSTNQIARSLGITPGTVQQHTSRILARTGTGSRGELVSLVFRSRYLARVRDNERRTEQGLPVRDGPSPLAPIPGPRPAEQTAVP